MWRQYSPGRVSSQAYLINNIHDKIKQQYLSEQAKREADIDQAYAKELQYYLDALKKYAKKLKEKKQANFFNGAQWDLFLQTLETIRSKDHNSKLSTLFGIKEGETHRFEKDIRQVIQAIQSTYQPKNKVYTEAIQLGQGLTNIQLSKENFANDMGQQVLEFFQVKTKQYLEGILDTGLAFQKVPVKIDTAGGATTISLEPIYDKEKIIPNFQRFSELMLSATFTQKNYATFHAVKLKQSNLLRTILDFLPQLDPTVFEEDGALMSFVFALFNRLTHNKIGSPPQTPNITEISKVLGQLDFIYRLTGRGQYYLDIESQELQEYLQQGARYLLYNVTKDSTIYVNSTKYLIYKRYEQLKQNANFAYGHNMRVTKSSMK